MSLIVAAVRLDSCTAQNLIRHIRRIAASGRTIVCTIHQPSKLIFSAFDSLLLLQRGGQMVYFGDVGEQGKHLVSYFEAIPGVGKLPKHTNPATWMLDIIIKTTTVSEGVEEKIDFHQQYETSLLHEMQEIELHKLIPSTDTATTAVIAQNDQTTKVTFYATSWEQFIRLYSRFNKIYWRTPSYTIRRIGVNIILALIFASAYAFQRYSTFVGVISRSSVIYISTSFCGILALIIGSPIMHAERPIFYREQQSRMYRVSLYVLAMFLADVSIFFSIVIS